MATSYQIAPRAHDVPEGAVHGALTMSGPARAVDTACRVISSRSEHACRGYARLASSSWGTVAF
jgi:hypothetical protein